MKLTELLDQIQERSRTAGDHVARLCTKEDRWKMSVPVQDDDSDILLTQITDRDVPKLAKALQAVLKECKEAQERFDSTPSDQDREGQSRLAETIESAIADQMEGVDD